MSALRKRAEGIKGPLLEDWKKTDAQTAGLIRPPYHGG